MTYQLIIDDVSIFHFQYTLDILSTYFSLSAIFTKYSKLNIVIDIKGR